MHGFKKDPFNVCGNEKTILKAYFIFCGNKKSFPQTKHLLCLRWTLYLENFCPSLKAKYIN